MDTIKTFEDLKCWKVAREVRNQVSVLIREFPSYEKFELASQMRRASRSVTHNIAEGYGRFHFKENAQFCRVSRGSLYELQDQLITALDEGYINEDRFKEMRLKVVECTTILNGYIKYLKSAENNY
ncbi:four helix bundle protein [Salinimicrobium sp. TH3]|uniref:four helix bundle protein n=1 Tax=Salinimicrobium sp. TH3 TaxID=2997342 RepID=UPI0022762C5C|nr:four helix bundle protein [Salinimicrobium sp. TH3]MCY2686312.1 four helix bundle protein [Salinimicrobium sp. TH3]